MWLNKNKEAWLNSRVPPFPYALTLCISHTHSVTPFSQSPTLLPHAASLTVCDAVNFVDEALVGELSGERGHEVNRPVQQHHGIYLRGQLPGGGHVAEHLLPHTLQQITHRLTHHTEHGESMA